MASERHLLKHGIVFRNKIGSKPQTLSKYAAVSENYITLAQKGPVVMKSDPTRWALVDSILSKRMMVPTTGYKHLRLASRWYLDQVFHT